MLNAVTQWNNAVSREVNTLLTCFCPFHFSDSIAIFPVLVHPTIQRFSANYVQFLKAQNQRPFVALGRKKWQNTREMSPKVAGPACLRALAPCTHGVLQSAICSAIGAARQCALILRPQGALHDSRAQDAGSQVAGASRRYFVVVSQLQLSSASWERATQVYTSATRRSFASGASEL